MNFRPVVEGRSYADWIGQYRDKSGVYLIRAKDGGEILYIGESHSDTLTRTLTRHFNKWTGPTAGPTYARSKVEVAVIKTRKERALEYQNALIEEHRPKDNIAAKPDIWRDFKNWLNS
jgi:excinuclease UvrABC nuclease subunit